MGSVLDRWRTRLENEDFVGNFTRMEQWLSDSVDVTNIDMPMLQIVVEYDNLVPSEASKPFNDIVGTDDASIIEYPSGHVGLAMSNGAHRDLWPEVAEWFLEHSEQPTLADVIGDGIENILGVDVETDVTVGDVDEMEVVVADEDDEIARDVVKRDATAIETVLEDALGVELGLDIGPTGSAVEVVTDEGVETTVVENIGEAIRTDVEEAVEEIAVAGSYDLEDVKRIGPRMPTRRHGS